MRALVSPELVNGVFGDPVLYLDFRDEKRALLFDVGDVSRLPPKRILRVSDVFVSHAHMDHFAGLDRMVRVLLGRGALLRLYGPPGFLERVEHKLSAYTWNLAERYPGDFALLAHELAPDGNLRIARFASRSNFARQPLPETRVPEGVLLDEPRFRVRGAFLDHGIPCLGFALEEKAQVNVWKNRLAQMGLETGPWLAELKARALDIAPGQKICYITDIRYHAENEARAARLAADADLFFIESVFLSPQADHAARKFHLTAAQAGRIARAARAKTVIPFHFSPRYEGRGAELVAELEASRSAAEGDPAWN
ncbi:MAG TPA: MBL fold metallo-hydrolase [Burkholderiales bacterium]|nr:MBL fold metallo-hydrolase [Burkholderiales bacterium]